MEKGISTWNKVLTAAMALPGVKVDRNDFLSKELAPYCRKQQLEKAINECPLSGVSEAAIERIANSCIKAHTAKVTTLSAVAGIPGGFGMVAAIPADMAQYYWHVLVLSQKLAYLYGYPDLSDEEGRLSDSAIAMLTLFVGVMMGTSVANQTISKIAQDFAKQVVKRLPKQALTHTVYYPVVKQVAKWIGIKLTKDSFAKGLGKTIPIIGGVISGSLTLATFLPSAKRLKKKMAEDMYLLQARFNGQSTDEQDNDDDFGDYNDYEDVTPEDEKEPLVSEEKLMLMALVNMGKIDHNMTDKKRAYLSQEIENSSLDEDDQLELAQALNAPGTFTIDLTQLANSADYAVTLMKKLVELCRLDGVLSLSEKIYIKKIARQLGFSPEDLDEFINA